MLTSSCHFYLFLIWVSHSIFFLKREMSSSTADASSHWQQHSDLQDLNPACICRHAQTFQVAMESKQTFTSAHLCHCSFICCLHVHSALMDGAYVLKMTHGSPVTTSKPWKTQATSQSFSKKVHTMRSGKQSLETWWNMMLRVLRCCFLLKRTPVGRGGVRDDTSYFLEFFWDKTTSGRNTFPCYFIFSQCKKQQVSLWRIYAYNIISCSDTPFYLHSCLWLLLPLTP